MLPSVVAAVEVEGMETKAYKGMGMEGGIARWYAKVTRKDYAEFQKLAARLADQLPAEQACSK